jgi:hypothetical protein
MHPIVGIAGGLCSLALLAGIFATWMAARGHGWRWGRTVERGPSVGEGAYRSALVSIERPRRMPAICALAAVTSFACGVLTVGVCAPAGAALVYAGVFVIIGKAWWFGPSVVGLAVAIVYACIIGPRLVGAVHVLAVRHAHSAGKIASLARQTLLLHMLVAAALALLCLGAGGDPILHALYAIPCAMGAAQAALLLGAAATLARLDREDAANTDLAELTVARR